VDGQHLIRGRPATTLVVAIMRSCVRAVCRTRTFSSLSRRAQRRCSAWLVCRGITDLTRLHQVDMKTRLQKRQGVRFSARFLRSQYHAVCKPRSRTQHTLRDLRSRWLPPKGSLQPELWINAAHNDTSCPQAPSSSVSAPSPIRIARSERISREWSSRLPSTQSSKRGRACCSPACELAAVIVCPPLCGPGACDALTCRMHLSSMPGQQGWRRWCQQASLLDGLHSMQRRRRACWGSLLASSRRHPSSAAGRGRSHVPVPALTAPRIRR